MPAWRLLRCLLPHPLHRKSGNRVSVPCASAVAVPATRLQLCPFPPECTAFPSQPTSTPCPPSPPAAPTS
eukprot:362014-Chlamydomonas_euryale.AAC.8